MNKSGHFDGLAPLFLALFLIQVYAMYLITLPTSYVYELDNFFVQWFGEIRCCNHKLVSHLIELRDIGDKTGLQRALGSMKIKRLTYRLIWASKGRHVVWK